MSRNYISHYGVPGMKWRFTKYTSKIRKGGKNVYEYFTKTGYTKRQQKRMNKSAIRDANGNIMGYEGKAPVARTQFERDFRKATKPIRKSWKKYYKNTLSPAMRRFKTAAPIKMQRLQYTLGGLKGKLISRLKGYNNGPKSNIGSLTSRQLKNAKMTDRANSVMRNYDKTHQNSSKSVGYIAKNKGVNSVQSHKTDRYGNHVIGSQSYNVSSVKPIIKTQYGSNAKNPYWGYGKKKKSSQSDYSKHYNYKRAASYTRKSNPYWGRK